MEILEVENAETFVVEHPLEQLEAGEHGVADESGVLVDVRAEEEQRARV